MEETYSKWPEWHEVYVYIKNLKQVGCQPLSRGYIRIKTSKHVYEIRLQRNVFLKLTLNGQSDKAFLLTSNLCPQGVVYPYPRAIYMWKKTLKMCIKSEYKEICLKLATNGRSDKGFLMTSKVCPQAGFCPCPGLYTCIKLFIMCLKSYFKEIVLKLATNEQSHKGFLWTSTFVPKGLSAPALGLYTCIKALKYIPGPGVRLAFTGPLVLWLIMELLSLSRIYDFFP